MSLEFPKTPDAHEVLRVKLEIQIELIKLFTGDKDPEEDKVLGWIETYSKSFHDLYEKKISEDPEFFQTYEVEKDTIIAYFVEKLREFDLNNQQHPKAA